MTDISLALVVFCATVVAILFFLFALDPRAVEIAHGFQPHGVMCLAGQSTILTMAAAGDLVTGISYLLIPVTLAMHVHLYSQYEGPYTAQVILRKAWLFWPLFAAFILFCGLGHFFKVVTLYYPIYWHSAAWTLCGTALLSCMTSGALLNAYFRARQELRDHHGPAPRPLAT